MILHAMCLPLPNRTVVGALTALTMFGALSAFFGSVLAVAFNGAGVPLEHLAHSPFSSYFVPGLILGVVIGGTQLAAALTLLWKRRTALLLSAVAGFGMLIWIFVELAVIRQYSWLQAAYFTLGVLELSLVLALLGIAPTVFHPLRWPDGSSPRHRTTMAWDRSSTATQVLKAGAVYFALVFGTGFALGTIRTLWIVPRLGIRTAELMEAPFMLAAIWLAGGWIERRFSLGKGPANQVAVGVFALALLLAAEITMGIAVQGLSLLKVFTKHDPVSGSVYYALLGVFAAMPWLFWKYRKYEIA
jgi:hypothetical protein